jgi:hypothetical protein
MVVSPTLLYGMLNGELATAVPGCKFSHTTGFIWAVQPEGGPTVAPEAVAG